MNKKYLKLGVLLVGLLAFFGGANVVSAGQKMCNAAASGDWYFRDCKAYGEDGYVIVHVGKNCDASGNKTNPGWGDEAVGGDWQIITKQFNSNGDAINYNELMLSWWNGYKTDNLSSNVAYSSMGSKHKSTGCPALVDLDLDGSNSISLNWGSALNVDYEDDVNYDVYYGYNAKFYSDSKTQMQKKIKLVETNVDSIKKLMSDDFVGVQELETEKFFITDPQLNIDGLPKLYLNYNSDKINSMTKTELNQLYNDLNTDYLGYKTIVTNVGKISPIIDNVQVNLEALLEWGSSNNLLEGEADTYNDVADYRYDFLVEYKKEADEDYITKKVLDKTFKNSMKTNSKLYYSYYRLLAGEQTNSLSTYVEKLSETTKQMQTRLQTMYNMAIAAENRSFDANFNIDKKFNVLADKIADLILEFGELEDSLSTQATTIGLVDFKWGDGKVEVNCGNLLGNGMSETLNTIFFFIEIVVVIIVVIMSMIDFAKAVTAGDADALKKAWKHTVIRAICVVVMFLLPAIINFILKTFNVEGVDSDNPLCLEIQEAGEN